MHDTDEQLQSEWQWLAVRNDEDQWAIWPEHLPLPAGWSAHGGPADKDTALQTVEQLWTDMRPRSVR